VQLSGLTKSTADSEDFLKRYLSTKKLTSKDFAEFYFAHPVAEKLRLADKTEAEFAKKLKID